MKTRWADGRVIANLSDFYYDYEDMHGKAFLSRFFDLFTRYPVKIQGRYFKLR